MGDCIYAREFVGHCWVSSQHIFSVPFLGNNQILHGCATVKIRQFSGKPLKTSRKITVFRFSPNLSLGNGLFIIVPVIARIVPKTKSLRNLFREIDYLYFGWGFESTSSSSTNIKSFFEMKGFNGKYFDLLERDIISERL